VRSRQADRLGPLYGVFGSGPGVFAFVTPLSLAGQREDVLDESPLPLLVRGPVRGMPPHQVEFQLPVFLSGLGMLAQVVPESHMREPALGSELGDVEVVCGLVVLCPLDEVEAAGHVVLWHVNIPQWDDGFFEETGVRHVPHGDDNVEDRLRVKAGDGGGADVLDLDNVISESRPQARLLLPVQLRPGWLIRDEPDQMSFTTKHVAVLYALASPAHWCADSSENVRAPPSPRIPLPRALGGLVRSR